MKTHMNSANEKFSSKFQQITNGEEKCSRLNNNKHKQTIQQKVYTQFIFQDAFAQLTTSFVVPIQSHILIESNQAQNGTLSWFLHRILLVWIDSVVTKALGMGRMWRNVQVQSLAAIVFLVQRLHGRSTPCIKQFYPRSFASACMNEYLH